MKVYSFNKANEIVVAVEVETLDEAEKMTRSWNKRHKGDEARLVEFIGNYREPKLCTKFRAIY